MAVESVCSGCEIITNNPQHRGGLEWCVTCADAKPLKELRNVSATQVTTFESCQRKWWYERIAGYQQPPSDAMLLGTRVHKAIETYLQKRKMPTDKKMRGFVEAAMPHIPTQDEKDFQLERPIKLDTGTKLSWIGFIDLLRENPVRVGDYKTTSDFRYAKTPDELSRNTQLISYAAWCYSTGYRGPIILSHLYLHTRRAKPLAKYVEVTVDHKHVDAVWREKLAIVPRMVDASRITNVDQLAPSPDACGDYGGCPHRARCGLITDAPFSQLGKRNGKESGMSFLSKLRGAENAGNGTSGVVMTTAAAPAPVAPTGVLSPDAPPRETTEEEAEQLTAPAKRGRKPMTLAEKAYAKAQRAMKAAEKAAKEAEALAAEETAPAAAPAAAPANGSGSVLRRRAAQPAPEPAPATPVATPAREPIVAPEPAQRPAGVPETTPALARELVLYIDCMPTKGPHVQSYTLFEDWYAGIAGEIARAADVVDYRLLPFAEEKAALTQSIIGHYQAKNLPSVLVVSSGTTGAKDALNSLIPFATQVIRALRG